MFTQLRTTPCKSNEKSLIEDDTTKTATALLYTRDKTSLMNLP